MRVLFINERCGTGSNGRLAKDLALAVEAKGGTSLIAYANGVEDYHNAYRIGNTFDHRTHAILSRLTGLQGYFSYFASRKLIKKIESFKPDVVHLHNLHGNYINLKMLLAYLGKHDIATVVTLHDCWFYTGKCTHYIMSGCEKWKSECGSCPRLHLDNVNPTFFLDRTRKCFRDKKLLFNNIERLGVVGVSKWITNEAKQSLFKNKTIQCIYNWVDCSVFYPRSCNLLDKHHFHIIFVASNFSEKKGYLEMVRLSQIKPEHWDITVIGHTSLPIPENVSYIERTYNRDQLAEYYSSADVCVNVTQAETFGLVTAESICCGTPVIVYDNTASPELVSDGCGFVVNQTDGIDGIIKAIKTIELEGKETYSINCRLNAKKFAMEDGIEKYLALYDRLTR